MRLVVTGGRDYSDTARAFAVLDELHARKSVTVIIQGEARGLDARAKNWAYRRGIPCASFAAQWDLHGKAAGGIRNQQMIDEGKPDYGLVFPGGTGTADMKARLVASGIPFEVVNA
jgi:hypothetical protein